MLCSVLKGSWIYPTSFDRANIFPVQVVPDRGAPDTNIGCFLSEDIIVLQEVCSTPELSRIEYHLIHVVPIIPEVSATK